MALANLTDDEVIAQCNEERERKRVTNSACLEVLRRAFVGQSSDAFAAVHAFYGNVFISWVVHYSRYEELRSREPYLTPDDVVQDAYRKLLRSLAGCDFYAKFSTIAHFMAYAHRTVNNLIEDYLPAKPKPDTLPRPAKDYRQNISLDTNEDLERMVIDSTSSRTDMDHQINWQILVDYVETLLTPEELAIFKHKILGNPTRSDLARDGIESDEMERIWKRVRRKLMKDPGLRDMI